MPASQPVHAPPEVGSAPGWPLVVYFHRVRDCPAHYTEIAPTELRFALDLLTARLRPLDPWTLPDIIDTGRPAAGLCLVTFDDGDLGAAEYAVPALEARSLRGIFFVSTDDVPHASRGDRMTWEDLRELRDRGHVVASHGAAHRDLSGMSSAELSMDIQRARAELAARVGPVPDLLAFPYGRMPNLQPGTLPRVCFGSVKARPQPWSDAPHAIRRTYFPSDRAHAWPDMVRGWWTQCTSAVSH